MEKLKVMQHIIDRGIISVIRANSPEQALKVASAVKSGGIDTIEITMTVPGAIDVIKALKKRRIQMVKF